MEGPGRILDDIRTSDELLAVRATNKNKRNQDTDLTTRQSGGQSGLLSIIVASAATNACV